MLVPSNGKKGEKKGMEGGSMSAGRLPVQALGVAVDIGPEAVARCIQECGVGFMFAPR